MNKLLYSKQVDLLLSILEDVMKSPDIALKGGTAINLFLLNMPRLSVDIDLTYLKILPRDESLNSIKKIFSDINHRLSKYPDIRTEIKYTQDGIPKQILVKRNTIMVKVELNLVLRGCVYDTTILNICSKAQDLYAKDLSIECLSFEDLYAGKFCAALDRQHPRDLFDIHYFFQNFEISEKLKNAFIVYLLCTNRPIHEILRPTLLNQQVLFKNEFESMTSEPFFYEDFIKARIQLIKIIHNMLTPLDKEFLLSFEMGFPKWELLTISHSKDMPAVKWKLHNIKLMSNDKRKLSVDKLQEKLLII